MYNMLYHRYWALFINIPNYIKLGWLNLQEYPFYRFLILYCFNSLSFYLFLENLYIYICVCVCVCVCPSSPSTSKEEKFQHVIYVDCVSRGRVWLVIWENKDTVPDATSTHVCGIFFKSLNGLRSHPRGHMFFDKRGKIFCVTVYLETRWLKTVLK